VIVTFLEEVAAERVRQITEKGYDSAHDDRHVRGQIASAAGDFALLGQQPVAHSWATKKALLPRRLQLVIAAALCMAEAERLERAWLSVTPDGS
jgi:hypothetical protein